MPGSAAAWSAGWLPRPPGQGSRAGVGHRGADRRHCARRVLPHCALAAAAPPCPRHAPAPTSSPVGHTRRVTQRVGPGARGVHVDDDPIVPAHARALLISVPEAPPTTSGPTCARPERSPQPESSS
ncbi:SAM-dependent methyltransferase [Streptomyces sp. NPDC003015]